MQSVPLGGGGSDLRIVARDDPRAIHERFLTIIYHMSFSLAVVDCAVAHPWYTLASALLLCFTGLATVRWSTSRCNPKRLPYPPGPKGYPIIKNLLDVPTDKPWLTYHEWGKTYGELHV